MKYLKLNEVFNLDATLIPLFTSFILTLVDIYFVKTQAFHSGLKTVTTGT